VGGKEWRGVAGGSRWRRRGGRRGRKIVRYLAPTPEPTKEDEKGRKERKETVELTFASILLKASLLSASSVLIPAFFSFSLF